MNDEDKNEFGDNNTIVGRVTGTLSMGSGNTIIGPMDERGRVNLTRGGTAIGLGARADASSIAIGAGAGAGAQVGVVEVLESLKGAVEGAGADQNLQRAALEALTALQDEAGRPATEHTNQHILTGHLKKVAAVIGWAADVVTVAAAFGLKPD